MSIKIYEVDEAYIDYLAQHEIHVYHNSKPNQKHSRKYIGIVLTVHEMNYFVPLSSFKRKHDKMHEMIDFLKIKNYAVLNINNMFPVPKNLYRYVNFSKIKDLKYKQLLQAEYRVIKSRQDIIRKNAEIVYRRKTDSKDHSSLSKRCNDFLYLEELAGAYQQNSNRFLS